MIYATEQQIVVTAGIVLAVALVALFTGMWWGYGRGREHEAEEQHWEREQAKARRTYPVYARRPLEPTAVIPPEVAHEAFTAHDEMQALALANDHGERMTTTGEIRAITAEMDSWLAEHVYNQPADYRAWERRQPWPT